MFGNPKHTINKLTYIMVSNTFGEKTLCDEQCMSNVRLASCTAYHFITICGLNLVNTEVTVINLTIETLIKCKFQ